MSRTRQYLIPPGLGSAFFLSKLAVRTAPYEAGVIPFTNLYNINVLGYGQYPNSAGTISQSPFFLGPCMSQLAFQSTDDLTGRTFTINGTDNMGNPVTETLTGGAPNTTFFSANQYFSSNYISINGTYTNIRISTSDYWTSSLFITDVERTFFNVNMSFTNEVDPVSFQLFGTMDEIFPTLPLPYSNDPNTSPNQNITVDQLNRVQLLPSTAGDFETADQSFFTTTVPYTAFWVQSNPDRSGSGLNIQFLQQGVT